MELKTRALFFTPSGKQFYEINIDGEKSSGFKQYFKPQLLANRQLCDVNELIGQWTVMFRGYEEAKLYFEMLPDILPNQEYQFVECEIAYVIDPTKSGTMPQSEKYPGSTPITEP